jgi:SAM-dependent methyltransferase
MTNYIERAELERRARVTWAGGDHDRLVDPLRDVGRRLLRRLGVGPGEDVLDIARAADGVHGLLPHPAERFDVVLSAFGCPPRHELTAHEIARVLRPTGRFGLADWTPRGAGGEFFTITAAHAAPHSPPALWGDERHVRELFAGTGIELDFVRETVMWRFDSPSEAVDTFASTLGPLVKAREALEPQGRWTTLRGEIAAWFERWNRSATHRLEFAADYLVVLGQKRGR